jgi:DNA topoisomerase-1
MTVGDLYRACNAPAIASPDARRRASSARDDPPRVTDTPASDPRLRHSTDARPGISRRRAGKGFSYVDADGRRIRDEETLGRIRSLAIPPAWEDVWICPDPLGHLQATGRDARGRKVYRYHPRFRARRESAKYERLVAFARALPAIRRRVDADLRRQGLPREKVLAAVVRLLELTLIRVGNDEYARLNRSFGLTTLKDRHATVRGTSIRFRFRGKSGVTHEVGLRDRRLATIVGRCRDLPGQELFQYLDEHGEPVDVASDDVNEYLRSIDGAADVTAKDFRTWAGTVLAYRALRALDEPETATQAKHNVVSAIRDTADRLGNTSAVCRASYVHPVVVEAYLDPRLRTALLGAAETDGAGPGPITPREERAVVRLLERRLASDAARSRSRRRGGRKPAQPRPGRQSASA